MVRDGAKVKKGDIIAKIIKLGEGTKDITGGLPNYEIGRASCRERV